MRICLLLMAILVGCEPGPSPPRPDPPPIPDPDPPSPDPPPVPPTPPAPGSTVGAIWEICDCKGYYRLTYRGQLQCDRCGTQVEKDAKLEEQIEELLIQNMRVTRERDKLLKDKYGL